MSSTEDVVVDSMALPTFELVYSFDDDDDPSTVTVYDPGARDIVTSWITVDAGVAVALEDVA